MRGNKVKSGLIIALACLLVVGLGACAGQAEEGQSQLVEVSRGDLMITVSADGNLSFVRDRKLTFGITGTIAEVNVEEGDWVSQGEVLARLDTTALELAARVAEVDVEIAEANYVKLTYPYTYSTFAFDVPTALAALADAKRELNKAVEALEIGLSFDQYWVVWRELEQAEDKLTEAIQRLARGRGEDVFTSGILNVADFWTVRAAQLTMEKAQVALDVANNDLEKAVMVAPFDGVIAVVNVKEGDSLSAMDYATRTIIELIDPTSMELSAEVDEIDIPYVELGQKAIIGVDALPRVQLEGEITSVSPLATEESGLVLYKIKVSFEVPEGSGLKAGMSATADIIIAERSGVLLVPNRAIGEDSRGNPAVKVVVDTQIEERAVVIGISDGSQTEIVSGLNEGEVVVVEKRSSFQPGGFTLGE
jgi:RND family efflux transporter MFP subunit